MNGIMVINWFILILSICNLILLSNTDGKIVPDPEVFHPSHF